MKLFWNCITDLFTKYCVLSVDILSIVVNFVSSLNLVSSSNRCWSFRTPIVASSMQIDDLLIVSAKTLSDLNATDLVLS